MRCGAKDAAECLHDHARPHLREPKVAAAGDSYSALAPCHDDTARSLTVSVGARRAIIWCCHACQERLGKDAAQIRTRSALIKAGVPARCLPVSRQQDDSMTDQFREILHSDRKKVDKLFLLAVLIECGGDPPVGGELDQVADWCGVSRRAAFDALRTERGASTDNL